MKDWLKLAGFVLLAIAMFYGIYAMNERRQQRLEAKCALSETCLNDRTASQSMSSTGPETSPSGKRYFRRVECSASCDEIVRGYRWAERVGLTNEEGCDDFSGGSRAGCLAYYDEFIESQQEPPEYDGPQ